MDGFRISTNPNGGLANIGFIGEAYIMANLTQFVSNPFEKVQNKFKEMVQKSNFLKDLKKETSWVKSFLDVSDVDQNYPAAPPESGKKKPAITAKLAMNYDFNNKVFHATLDVYINTPRDIIRDTGNNGKAGFAVLHIAPSEWYLYIGTPANMIGLKIGMGSFYITSQGYFMVGSRILQSPPPVEVMNILSLRNPNPDYMKNLNMLSKGKGFAFGAQLKFGTGDMAALFLYARFQAGIGGGITLKNYGQNATCRNRGDQQIGINGWYANGQLYAYLQGELGIRIKLFFIKKIFPLSGRA